MDISSLEKVCRDEPMYRLKQANKALFCDLVCDWDEAFALPKTLRDALNDQCKLGIEHEYITSTDGKTVKAIITLSDGFMIETVLMRHSKRNTVCVSCQVGCPMGCAFCATGKMGFKRNLNLSEIVSQTVLFARMLNKNKQKITNVVFMGMGEPFLNYDVVIGSIRFLNDPETFGLGIRRFSISTAGLTSGIEKLSKEGIDVNLAISLHAPNNQLRSRLMPVNDRFPLPILLSAVKDYQQKTGRKVMFEYALIKDVNDTVECAEELAKLLADMICTINLIPYNNTGTFKRSENSSIDLFKKTLEKRKLNVTRRYEYGKEVSGACGQLTISTGCNLGNATGIID